ncbi:hypothetical protein HG530_009249 [Fusarium avenaceum]|nr:hypothetical protein HG530_009249 [Fusarium avenaceum]
MSKIQVDCELMLQPFPERSLTDAESFHILQDAEARPIILCIASNRSLLMVAPDELGQNQLINLSERLSLPSTVRSLAVTQDHVDNSKIYLVVTTGAESQQPSRLHVLKPFRIEKGRWWEELDWPSLLLKPINDGKFEVHKLLLAGRCDQGKDFPFLAAETSVPGIPKHNVSLINIDTAEDRWQWESGSVLPFDVSDIDCLCVASSVFTSGILYLDKTQGQPTVTFAELRTTGPAFFCNLPILPNPTSIATITDPDGASNVLITGDGGVLHVPAQDWTTSFLYGTIWEPTLHDIAFQGAHEVHVAQDGLSSTVWAINGEGNVVGQNTRLVPRVSDEGVLDLKATGKAVPLFPTNDAVRHFEATIDAKTKRRQLFVLKTGGSVTWFDQPGDSDLWATSDLRIPDIEEIKDVAAYTCQIRCFDEHGAPLANTDLRVSASSQVRSAIHGEVVYLSQVSRPVQTDEAGSMTIIVPSSDLVVPTLKINGVGLPETSFRPADKVIKKLSALAQSGKLKDARNKDGSALFPKLNDNAVQSISQLHASYSQQQTQQNTWSNAETFDPIKAQHGDSWGFGDWAFLQGLISGVEKVVDFVCEAGRLIVNTAKKAWTFVVKTAEQALKAISSVFEWIGAKIEDALVWLAEQLDWESIMDVQLFIKSLVLTGLNCVEDTVTMGREHLDHLLERAEKEVGSWHSPPQLPASLANQTLNTDPNKDKDKTNVMDNPLCRWADSKLQDKQVRKSMDVEGSQAGQSLPSNIFDMFFEKVLKGLWDILGDTASHIWEDLRSLLDIGSSVTMADTFKNIGVNSLLAIIQVLRKSTSLIFDLVTQIISLFRSFLNEKLNIWVLTKVYQRVSGGDDLTILNLASLVFAVPATYLFKLFSLGKKPRDAPAFAKILSELKSSTIFESLALNTHWGLSQDPRGLESAQLLSVLDHKSSATWGGEHAATTIKRKFGENPNLDTFMRLSRGGMVIVSCAMPFWTIFDTITTSKSWPTALDREGLPEGRLRSLYTRFSPTVGLVAFVVTLGTSVVAVVQKTNTKRNTEAIILRWCLLVGKNGLNLVKTFSPKDKKPVLCGVIAVVDMISYVFILALETGQEETDSALEAAQRFLENGWALGSYLNCRSRGLNPYIRVPTLVAGGVMAVGNTVAAVTHVAYYIDHKEDDEYHAPSWSNSLSGSLW